MQALVGSNLNARPPVNNVAGLGRRATGFTTRSDTGPAYVLAVGNQEGFDENQKFDEFEGNCLRKDRREARLNHEEIEKYWDLNTQITEQFVDLKRKLGTLSDAEWDGNPEIGDHSLRNKKKTS
ncbi:protein stabilized1 [Tanacetum coccineum]